MPVSVKGAVALRSALRKFEPDLGKAMTKEIGNSLKPVVRQARGFVPSNTQILSNWSVSNAKPTNKFPIYDAAIAKRGIKYKSTPSKPNRRGFRSLARIMNISAAGAIYETAGRKNPNSVFVKNLQAKTGGVMKGDDKMRGRLIYRAWEQDRGKAQDGVLRAIEAAKNAFNARTKVKP